MSCGKVEASGNITFGKSVPTAADKEAAAEADKIITKVRGAVSHNMLLSTPTTGSAEDSDAVSLDSDPGPTSSTDKSDKFLSQQADSSTVFCVASG